LTSARLFATGGGVSADDCQVPSLHISTAAIHGASRPSSCRGSIPTQHLSTAGANKCSISIFRAINKPHNQQTRHFNELCRVRSTPFKLDTFWLLTHLRLSVMPPCSLSTTFTGIPPVLSPKTYLVRRPQYQTYARLFSCLNRAARA
jgi:hypothetical protein